MARVSSDQPLVPSVLDRLLDDQPQSQRESPKSRTQVLRELKQSLRRDLENLLNTRRRCKSWPAHLEELEVSLVNYGLPDITGAHLSGAANREEFQRVLEEVVRRFEPRFKNVAVEMLSAADPLDRVLRFRIDALVEAEPAPEPVAFDSAVRPVSGAVEVIGARR